LLVEGAAPIPTFPVRVDAPATSNVSLNVTLSSTYNFLSIVTPPATIRAPPEFTDISVVSRIFKTPSIKVPPLTYNTSVSGLVLDVGHEVRLIPNLLPSAK